MYKEFYLLVILFIVSCKSKQDQNLNGYKPILEQNRTESIQYISAKDQLIQLVISNFKVANNVLTDTTIIHQRFIDSLLVQEVELKVFRGDTSTWRNQIIEYDKHGNITLEIDSIDGSLRTMFINDNFYLGEVALLDRSRSMDIYAQLEVLEDAKIYTTGFDTIRFEEFYFYNNSGIEQRIITITTNDLSSKLTGELVLDTTYTSHNYDNENRLIRSTMVEKSDTISISTFEYDNVGNEIRSVFASRNSGYLIIDSEFDSINRKTSEITEDELLIQKTEFFYDDSNRVVLRNFFSSESSARDSEY